MMRGRCQLGGLLVVLAAAGFLLGGCGEKIAIPEPVGLFSVSQYYDYGTTDIAGVRDVVAVQGAVFVVTGDSLVRFDQDMGDSHGVGGLADARAVCTEPDETWLFVWEEAARRVSWHRRDDLSFGGSADLPEVAGVTAMATSPVGVEAVPGAQFFLYLAEPDSGNVRRYSFDAVNGLVDHRLMSHSGSNAVRSVHVPDGLARDWQDNLLVSDRDSLRNWVIRFDPVPDVANPDLAGLAILFKDEAVCPEAAADEYVIGNAPGCNQTDWTGGVSDAEGEFHTQHGVAVDGSGRIMVADTGNDRIQIFDRYGDYLFEFGSPDRTPGPARITTLDLPKGALSTDIEYGAFIYVAYPERNEVRRYISNDYYIYVNRRPPPPPE